MTEKTLVLEGLPDDIDTIKAKLDLYFKNKRRSGGEILQIQDYPGDKRKALLVYPEYSALQKVLERRCHKIDFKEPLGVVELQVKLKEKGGETEVKKFKPLVFPRRSNEKLLHVGKTASNPEKPNGQEDVKKECLKSDTPALLVKTSKKLEKTIIQLYFDRFDTTEKGISFTKHGNYCWILKLPCQSVAEEILSKTEHELGLSVEVYDENTSEGKLDNKRFILTGFNDCCGCNIVPLFISGCSQGAEHVWEALDDGDRVVVTFKREIDVQSFLKKVSSKKVQEMEIEACQLELTDSVLVQGEMSQIKGDVEEVLNLYFSSKRSKGGEIKSHIWVTKDKSMVITFEDFNVAYQVAEQKHNFSGVDLIARLFYSSLQKALTGQTVQLTEITTNLALPLNSALFDFINSDESHKQYFRAGLAKVHASVFFNTTTAPCQMELKMTLEKDSLGMLRSGHTWERNARRESLALLEKYKEVHLPTEEDIWKIIESCCLGLNSADVCVSYKKRDVEIVLVGVHDKVRVLVNNVEQMIKKVREDLETERNTVTRQITLKSEEELDFISSLVSGKLVDVELSEDRDSFIINLKGLENKVSTAEGAFKETMGKVESKLLVLSAPLVEFLKSLNLKTFERDHFAQNHISSVFLQSNDSIQILAEKADIQRAEDKVHEVIKEEVIKLTSDQAHVTIGEQWEEFLKALRVELQFTKNNHNVSILVSQEDVSVCGFSSVVADVAGKLRGYLENKKPETLDVPLKSVQEVEFVTSCMNLSEVPEIKDLSMTILPCKTQDFPCLKITAASDKISKAVDTVKQQVSTIIMEKHKYSKAGVSKVLEKNQVALQAKAKDFGCNLYLSAIKSTKCQKYSYNIEYITLTVGQGNISQITADALICPLSKSMSFDTPIAKQILQIGGPEIKKVLDKFVKEKQTLQVGDVVLSDPGTLGAQHLIYAVIPECGNDAGPFRNIYLQSAVQDSLRNADNKRCVSIWMPVMGCGTFGFSATESCAAVLEGVKNFLKQKPQHLKNIYVMDSDAKTVEEFQSAIEGEGYQQTTATNATSSTGDNTPTSPIAVTIGGVSVTLKKGDITNETVDVIVNSNNNNLDLLSGVSGAILKAAGKSVVDQCKSIVQLFGPVKANAVKITSGGALKCKHIFHIVGNKRTSDITTSIKKVLKTCETRKAQTVSIPTIGTGKGGIGPEDSIKAILEGVENHLSTVPSSNIQLISIVTFEQNIFDSVRNYINKRNLSPHTIHQAKTASMSIPTRSSLPSQVKIHGVTIEIKKGNITQETVRGIVNTTNANIGLAAGVSAAILKAAGSEVEQECKTICPLKGDVPGVTSGGLLQCDFILHMLGPHSVTDATLRVSKVLESCEDKQISTLSFPAVGTGGGGLKGIDSVGAILQGIQNHLSQCTSSVLKLIYLVIAQDNIFQEFLKGLDQWKTRLTLIDDSEEDDSEEDDDNLCSEEDGDDTTDTEEDDTSVQTDEAVIGPMKVKVVCGDITKETTEAIVSSTNTTLNLNSGVSGAILKAAGQTVVDECTALGTQPDDGVVMTKPGNLPTKNIIHMVGQTKEKDITSSMLKVLKMCEDKKIQSVSFPALGTGAGNLGAAQVGEAMIAAITDLQRTIKTLSIKTIHIVVFQTNMMKDFEDVLKNVKKVKTKPVAVKKVSKLTIPGQAAPTQPALCLATACMEVEFLSMEAEVYGLSPASLAQVKKLLDEIISEECISQEVASSYLSLLQEKQKQAIVALSKKEQVHIQLASSDKMTVSGKKDNVLYAVLQIKDYLQETRDRKSRESEEKRMRETVRWKTREGETWDELDQSHSYDLEMAFHGRKKKFNYNIQGETYTVDLKNMKRTDSKGTISRLKRALVTDSDTALIQFPHSWTQMDNKDFDMVTLDPTSAEYQSIEKDFVATSKKPSANTQPTITIVQIQRIQSKDQWQRYAVKKQALDKKYPKNKNELKLYHGTTKDICQKINTCGFNRSFCGRNATAYGNGTYFAKGTWYSCNHTYSNPDDSGQKYVYRARVLVGKPCQGVNGMKEPNPLNPTDISQGLFDCAVDNLQNPFIYVVFCDAGAYPDYLIIFKTA